MTSIFSQFSRYPTACFVIDIISIISSFLYLNYGFGLQIYNNIIISMVLLLVFFIFPIVGVYKKANASLIIQLWYLFFAWCLVFVSIEAIFLNFYGYTFNYSIQLFVISSSILIISRLLLWTLKYYWQKNISKPQKILIYGAGSLGLNILEKVQNQISINMKILGFIDDNLKLHNTTLKNIEILGGLSNLVEISELLKVDEIWIALPLRDEKRINQIQEKMRHSTTTLRLIPDLFIFKMINRQISNFEGVPIINLTSAPIIGINRLIKDFEDRILALIIIVLVSPLLVVIAFAIKITSKGPIIFKQVRHGWNNEEIIVYKFRSMHVHSELDNQLTQAKKLDLRVTSLGIFLRRSSLDELPQFINVLQGRMSIVGPRPHAVLHDNLYKDQVPSYIKRQKVKPGITGWAQVNGWRGEVDTLEKIQKRIEFDLYYIENWNVFFDLKIIFRTIAIVFNSKDVY